MFRRKLKDFLLVYPIEDVYKIISDMGNFPEIRKNFIKAFENDFTHPVTYNLLLHYGVRKSIRLLKKRMISYGIKNKFHKEHGTNWCKWWLVYRYKH